MDKSIIVKAGEHVVMPIEKYKAPEIYEIPEQIDTPLEMLIKVREYFEIHNPDAIPLWLATEIENTINYWS